MPIFTPEQAAAIDARDVSVALSAGAGCGKTFVLTQRFLAQISPRAQPAELSSVVAITFTDRAAREMRDRVRKACRERLTLCPAEEADHWRKLVREVDSARISTIHSFCMTLLRTHAVEAGVDPQSRLFDETTGSAFLQRSLVQSLHDLLLSRDTEALELVQAFNWEGALDRLAQLVPQRYRIDLAAWSAKTPRQLADHWISVWNQQVVPQLLNRLVESAAARNVLRLLRTHSTTHPKMAERCQTLLAELPAFPKSRNPLDAIQTLTEAAAIRGGGTKNNWPSEEAYNDVRDSFAELRRELKELGVSLDYNPDLVLESARISLAALRVAERAGGDYDRRKREEGWLDFDDLLISACGLLRNDPEVRRRAASGVSLLMVDEFQDTDRLQAEIVRLLCGDELTRGKLFLVGDVKQSIYRFRRAEPRVFRELRAQLPERGRLPLTGNFRSQPAILEFVNALCDEALGGEYEALSPQTPQLSTEPCIEFLFATPDGEPAEVASKNSDSERAEVEDHAADPGASREGVEAQRRREAAWIAGRLKQLLDDRVPRIREKDSVTGRFQLRTVEPRDIVILFRAMTDVRHYEEALREAQIDHYVVGGRAFYAQQEIYDVVNLCRVLDDPDDQVALVGVLRSPFFSLTDDDLFQSFSHGTQGSVSRRHPSDDQSDHTKGEAPCDSVDLLSSDSASRAFQTISELRRLAPRCGVAQLLQAAIDATGYDAALLTEFLGERKLGNLRKLIDLARDFDRTGVFTLADFARHISSAVAEETRESLAATHPESSNVVRLMTIHQSKGLEFPVVVVADMNRRSGLGQWGALLDERLGPLVSLPRRFSRETTHLGRQAHTVLEADEELAETQRLLYVATTRAADLLILSASLREGDQGFEINHPWMRLLQDRFDLRTGQPRMAPGTGGVSVLARYAGKIPAIRVHHSRPEFTATPRELEPRRLALNALRAAVAHAEPVLQPASLRVYTADTAIRDRYTVSELETLTSQFVERRGRNDLEELASLVEIEWTESEGPAELVRLSAEESTLLGTLVHRAVELMDDDPRESLDRVCRSAAHDVSAEVRNAAARCLDRLRRDPLFEELKNLPPTQREVDFLLPWPGSERGDGRLIAGQIDALLRTRTGWTVVDYKTGTPGPRQELTLRAFRSYGVQLGIYCLAVSHWTGTPPEKLGLIYLAEGVNVWIVPTRRFIDKLVSLLDETLRG